LHHLTRACVGRTARACWLLAAALALGACSGNNNRGVNSSVGSSTGVSLTSSTGTVSMNAGDTITLTATVTNDAKNAGVTWTLTGDGTLSSPTSTTVVYTAPASVVGTTTPVIAATSVTDTTQNAAATLFVSGTPFIETVPLFPANATVAYAASISAAGGASPFTWALTGGALPDGITQAGNTGSYETISGTPTTVGTYPFQLTVTDANGKTASVNLTLLVNAAASCLLNGRYAFLSTGITAGQMATRAAAFSVDTTGAMTGVVDRKQSDRTTVAEAWTGTCTNRTGNSGQLAFTGTTDSPTFNFSVSTALSLARVQLTSGGDTSSSSGQLWQQTPSDFNLTALAGTYAFGLLGSEASDRRMGLVGELTVSANGTVTAGRMDSNASTPLTAASLTGTMSAPDSSGRGTLTLSGGGQTLQFAYYVVNAGRLLVVESDTTGTTPRLAGSMTRRIAAFNAASLTNAAVMTLWGATGSTQPTSVLSIGRLSGASAATGSFSLVLDTANQAKTEASFEASATSYSVESDGRVTLNFTLNGATRQLLGYLDNASNGYLVERNSAIGAAGLLEAQMSGPFSSTVSGLFVAGTQFPQSASPLALMPVTYLSGGNLTSSSASGYVAIDSASGRGLGTLTISGLGGVYTALYIVNPDKMVALRFGSNSQNGAMEWLVK
jgi:hypothetical protein